MASDSLDGAVEEELGLLQKTGIALSLAGVFWAGTAYGEAAKQGIGFIHDGMNTSVVINGKIVYNPQTGTSGTLLFQSKDGKMKFFSLDGGTAVAFDMGNGNHLVSNDFTRLGYSPNEQKNLLDKLKDSDIITLYEVGKRAFEKKDYQLARNMLEQAISGQEKAYNNEQDAVKKKAEGERLGGMYYELALVEISNPKFINFSGPLIHIDKANGLKENWAEGLYRKGLILFEVAKFELECNDYESAKKDGDSAKEAMRRAEALKRGITLSDINKIDQFLQQISSK